MTSDHQSEFIQQLNQHTAILHKICRLYATGDEDRKDLFQEMVIQLWRSYPAFRGDSKFSTWMYRIALNTAIADLRKQKKKTWLYRDGNSGEEIPDLQYNDNYEEKLVLLQQAIEQLNDIEKAIVMLFLDDKSYQEMEDILGIRQNNLRVKMNRIKDKLRKLTKAVDHGT